MSTVFSNEFRPYIIETKYVSMFKSRLQCPYESLTGLWVGKAGRPYLYGRRADRQVVEHILHSFDAPQSDHRDRTGSRRLPD